MRLFTHMGERKHREPELDDVFLALSHPARRRMLELLQQRSYCVTDLAQQFDLSLNVVSKHLKSLERAGLLTRTHEGRVHRLAYEDRTMQPAVAWLTGHLRMWQDALGSLERFVAQNQPNPKTPVP